MIRRRVLAALAIACLPMLMGHGGGGCGEGEDELGAATQATCRDSAALTYDSFGRTFLDTYCTRCHSSTKSGEDRKGAPLYHDFDTLEGVRAVADHVDRTAGVGPGATNTQMPPSGPLPSEQERQQLAEWLACGAP